MKRRKKAIQLFIEMNRFENRNPTKSEFDEWWQGANKYYYQVKKQFEENYDYYMQNGDVD